jgi:hypothetical protein
MVFRITTHVRGSIHRVCTPGSPEAETLTFQLRPKLEEVNVRIPQSPYTHGLLVGIADGSVRMLNPNISPRTFWAAVTPNGGEVLGPEW